MAYHHIIHYHPSLFLVNQDLREIAKENQSVTVLPEVQLQDIRSRSHKIRLQRNIRSFQRNKNIESFPGGIRNNDEHDTMPTPALGESQYHQQQIAIMSQNSQLSKEIRFNLNSASTTVAPSFTLGDLATANLSDEFAKRKAQQCRERFRSKSIRQRANIGLG